MSPIFNTRLPDYKPKNPTTVSWDTFRGGLNTLLNSTEIKKDELAQADNLLLEGEGIPTKRWGTNAYFMGGATGMVRGQGAYINGSTNEILALTDWGILTKKSGASYSTLSGASWPSGYDATMTQLNNKVYIVSPQRALVRYDGTTLIGFASINTPTISSATNLSGASGLGELTAVSYRVSAEGRIGETLASTAISLASVQAQHDLHRVRVTWGAVSAASGDLVGYVVYGRDAGNETFMSRVNDTTLTFDDDGSISPSLLVESPTADSTGGPRAKYVKRFKDRLVLAGIENEPTKVFISGPVPNHEKFHWSIGGGFVLIDPDSGESITGLGMLRNDIIVFKERSVWKLSLELTEFGNFTLLDPQYELLTASHGAVSHDTIVPVEDDLFFLSRKGVYALGFKPQILNVLTTTEISAKVRDKLENINAAQWERSSAEYKNSRYIVSYPEANQTNPNKILAFDRERIAWTGPWTIAANHLFKYYDADNKEILTYGSNATPYVYEMSSSYGTDSNVAIPTTLRTRKEDFGEWNLFKTLKDIFLQLRDVIGGVDVSIFIEERSGNIATAKSFTITPTSGNSGWGSAAFVNPAQWGDSEESAGGGDLTEILRWIILNKTGRSIQLQITTDSGSDTYKLLGVRMEAQVQGKGSIPASYRV